MSRSFEEAYQERDTAASILAGLAPSAAGPPGATEVSGRYLTARVSVSDTVAAPGHRVTLFVDVTPGRNVHVYAPGQAGYIPIAVTLDSSPDFKIGASRYPAPADYVFAPLKERVKVFDKPFRILQDVTLSLTPSLRQRASREGHAHGEWNARLPGLRRQGVFSAGQPPPDVVDRLDAHRTIGGDAARTTVCVGAESNLRA